ENASTIENFILSNENYIEYYVNDSNIVLLRNDFELTKYLEDVGKPLTTIKKSNSASNSNTAYQKGNLELYYKCCYDTRGYFDWISNCWSGPGSCAADGREVARLKDFKNASLWSSLTTFGCGGPLNCYTFDRIYPFGDPDNQLESVIARNVFARFYEHTNYGGRSIVLDARGGQSKGYRKLRQVRNGGGWKDRISSIKLSN
ncbi:MAG: hypothetical protein AAF039_18840, partial [Bacteroidota bacterium]